VRRIVFVGTSDAFGAGGRRQAAILLESRTGRILLDCAPTTGTGLAALGIERESIDAILLSHYHADHFAGLPQFLLASLYEDRRARPLVVAGPGDVASRVWAAARAMGHAFDPEAFPFELRFTSLAAGRELDLGAARVSAFAAHHQPDSEPHGLVVEAGTTRVVYTGDTGWFEGLAGEVEGASLLVSECTFFERDFEYHMNYRTLRDRMDELDCGRIIITHLGAEMAHRRGALEIETADDGLTVPL
jgi:ribonuclease BN (tRNA processing enzyme)